MQIRIAPQNGVPLYLQVVQQVRTLVSTGRLDGGEQLPPVRKLAEQLLINPNTVARAYRELESEGVVVSRRGAGVFVSNEPSPLSRRERNRRLNQQIDALLATAVQLDISLDELPQRVEKRSKQFFKESSHDHE